MDENFEKIKQRADSYGYNINYGRVKDNDETNHDLIKVIVAGAIVFGGLIYLKHKIKKLIKDVFGSSDIQEELKPCNVNYEESISEKENVFFKKEKLFNQSDKNEAVDVDYIIQKE